MADRSDENGRQQFTPGPSFTDDVPADEELTELPSWLQSFASSVEDADVDEAVPEPVVETASVPESDDPSMPGWLSGTTENARPGGRLSSTGGGSFFSEDDLPEWLRALSAEDAPAEPESAASRSRDAIDDQSAAPVMQVLTAPSVSNVWITGMEERNENPAAELFSVIATSGSSRPEPVVATAPRVGQSKAPQGGGKAAGVGAERGGRRSSWTRRERVLLIAVIVMLLLLVFVFNSNFGS